MIAQTYPTTPGSATLVLGRANNAPPTPTPDTDGLMLPPRPRALQAFAALLREVYALPCHLLWYPQETAQHCRMTWTAPDGCQSQMGTEADLAHALHVLGMVHRAAQHQRSRHLQQEASP